MTLRRHVDIIVFLNNIYLLKVLSQLSDGHDVTAFAYVDNLLLAISSIRDLLSLAVKSDSN